MSAEPDFAAIADAVDRMRTLERLAGGLLSRLGPANEGHYLASDRALCCVREMLFAVLNQICFQPAPFLENNRRTAGNFYYDSHGVQILIHTPVDPNETLRLPVVSQLALLALFDPGPMIRRISGLIERVDGLFPSASELGTEMSYGKLPANAFSFPPGHIEMTSPDWWRAIAPVVRRSWMSDRPTPWRDNLFALATARRPLDLTKLCAALLRLISHCFALVSPVTFTPEFAETSFAARFGALTLAVYPRSKLEERVQRYALEHPDRFCFLVGDFMQSLIDEYAFRFGSG